MGLYDRDYYREDSGKWSRWAAGSVSTGIMIVLGGVFLLQLLSRSTQGLDEIKINGQFLLAPVMRGEVWRIITAPLVHPHLSLLTILFTLLILYFFGRTVESDLGGPEYLRFFIASLLLGQLAELALRASGAADPRIPSSGASAGIAAIIVLYACLYPNAKILLMFVLPVPAWLIAALLVGGATFAMFGAPGLGAPSLPLTGAAFAFLYHRRGWNLGKLATVRRTASARRPKLRVIPLDDEPSTPPLVRAPAPKADASVDELLEARVDSLLRKVSDHGPESLSDEERQVLVKASEVYRKRRT